MSPNATRKMHLKTRLGATRAACGLDFPTRFTNIPADVTCDRCRHTVQMADAEILATHRARHGPHRPHVVK